MSPVPLGVLLVAAMASWAVVAVLRNRRRRYCVANRTRLLEECLDRARTKQSEHQRRDGRPGPSSGEDALP